MKHNKKETTNPTFPNFAYPAQDISAFHLSLNSFVLSLKTGELVRFAPKDTDAFLLWLKNNRIKDVR